MEKERTKQREKKVKKEKRKLVKKSVPVLEAVAKKNNQHNNHRLLYFKTFICSF